ncbi:hypothetical protein MMC18_009571, partial [Xylographa bjoerkii]|nr:hypothetical protein [Xylographa bjoerkii]
MTIKNAHAKTCKWLLKRSEYLDWLDADKLKEHDGFLWIRGKPGTGKSTLMKFAVVHARKTMKGKVVIAFFFNARGEAIEKSTVGTYRSLLLQLLERLPALRCIFDSFERAIKLLTKSSVVCFIDALDECEEQQIREIIQFFEHIGELAISAGNSFRICLSSRHYPYITIRKGLGLVLEGQEGHTQDIANYLESELKIGQSKIAHQIRIELQAKASGVFMWVALVVGILNKEHDRGRMHALRRRLQEIPGDLHDLFRDILTRDSHNKDELVLCIQWMLFAKQPLRWDHDEITEDVIMRFILNSFKGLAEITTFKLSKVQSIHESVRDFLLKEDGLGNIWPNLRSNFQGQSHERLKHCCLTYMSMNMFFPLRIPESLPKATSQHATDLRKSVTDTFPFLEYAVQNVLHHADVAEGNGIAQETFVRSFSLNRWIKLDNLFERHEVRRHTDKMSLLYILGERNMSNLIKAHPSALSCLEVEEERYGPPLFAAMATGSKEAFQAFAEALHRGQVTGSRPYETYSQYFENKNNPIYLGRDFNFSKRRDVLSYLAELGNEIILALVLGLWKANIDSKDYNGRTPLSWAAASGHEAVVKLLIDTGKVDVDSMDSAGETPLSRAASSGHEAVVKLLIDTGKVD